VALGLLLASTSVRAASSSEAALRARVEEMYTALQRSDWRRAEKYLTKESRPIYRAQPKGPLTGFQIESVKVEANGRNATVVVRIPGPPGLMPGPPVFVPQTSSWRRDGGKWYMELSAPSAAHPLPNAMAQVRTSRPNFSLQSKDLKFQSTWASVGFVHQGEVKVARFAFTNVSQHVVTLSNVESDCPCVRMKSQQKEFKPGEAGVLEFELDPSNLSFNAKLGLTLTETIQTEPEHAVTRLTIGAALTPGSAQAQHP